MKQRRRVIPIQPEPGADLPETERAAVREAVAAHRERPGALIEVLHAVQAALRHVPERVVPLIAHELNLTRAEVHGVLSFYHDFRKHPPGRHILRLCRAEACQALGAAELETHARTALGIDFHGTTTDGSASLEAVYCLGNCALGPSLMIDEALHGRVSPARFDALVQALESPA